MKALCKVNDIELSDSEYIYLAKKAENEFSLSIGERLTQGKEAYRIAKKSRSTINMVNKNRYGLTYDKINKKIL